MGSLGTYLRELRSAKDVSLDEVTRATRVGRAHLEALEAEDLASLPAPVFVKGFIRAYCEFLETDPGEALSRYRELTGDRSHTASTGHLDARGAGLGRGPVFVSVILLVVLGTALFILNSGRDSSPHHRGPARAGGVDRAGPGTRRGAYGPGCHDSRDDLGAGGCDRRGVPRRPAPGGQGARAYLDPRADRRGPERGGALACRGHARVERGEALRAHGGKCRRHLARTERPPAAAHRRAGGGDPRARPPRRRRLRIS
jgi:hypothetical protein